MKKCLTLAVVAVICAASVACQPGAAGLSDQDKAAIRKANDDAVNLATAAKPDWAAYVKLFYAEDATILAANTPPVRGHAAIQAMMESLPPLSEFKLETIDLDGRADVAYERGAWSMTMNPPGAPPVTDKGKYVVVWKKQADGTWKASYDSFSSDLPVPGIVVPTGAVAADASAEVKRLGDLVGTWKFDGTWQADPKTPAGAVAIMLTCDWFAGGRQLVYRFSGSLAGSPFEEVGQYSYDPRNKTYSEYYVASDGTTGVVKLTIQPGTWIHVGDTMLEGKPAKTRMTMANMSAAGGTWKYELSVAGGPFTTVGEGKYTKAN